MSHSFVDSNEVRNGQTYYYAVVAYDHGDSLGIPPSETSKKISLNPITSELTFDDNTVQVTPGPRASGYDRPVISEVTDIVHVSGVSNGIIKFDIINDLDIKDNIYSLTFSDTLYNPEGNTVAKNYSVIGDKPTSESFYLYGVKFTSLQKSNLINDAVLQVKDAAGNIFQLGVDYELNFSKGAIKRTDNSPMQEGTEYFITYKNYSVYQSTALNNEDSNPVFDGVLVKLKDYTALGYDPARSKWSRSDLTIPVNVGLSSLGSNAIKKLWPADYLISFSDVFIDSAMLYRQGQPLLRIPVKYKVEVVASGITSRIPTILKENVIKDTAWSRGDEIIFFKPGSMGVSGDTLTWGFTVTSTTLTDSAQPSPGDTYLMYTTRPFSKSDVFTLQTKAGFVDNRVAASKLDNIYVVPNPYVGTNEIEPANKLSGQNRGERRIYFENLPMKCTIRIYTLSGELVAALDHDTGVDNGREFWNLLNHDGFSVAYGVYLAHIDAPGVGEKLIKFALIK